MNNEHSCSEMKLVTKIDEDICIYTEGESLLTSVVKNERCSEG